MKRTLTAVAVLAGMLALAGCSDEVREDPVDVRYEACLAAGGSFEYNGSISYFQCVVPGAPTEEGHISE